MPTLYHLQLAYKNVQSWWMDYVADWTSFAGWSPIECIRGNVLDGMATFALCDKATGLPWNITLDQWHSEDSLIQVSDPAAVTDDHILGYLWSKGDRIEAARFVCEEHHKQPEELTGLQALAYRALTAPEFGDPDRIVRNQAARICILGEIAGHLPFDTSLDMRQEALHRAWGVVRQSVRKWFYVELARRLELTLRNFFAPMEKMRLYDRLVVCVFIPDDIEQADPRRGSGPAPEWPRKPYPWELIPDERWHRTALWAWWSGYKAARIADLIRKDFGLTKLQTQHVYNSLSQWRQEYGVLIIPDGHDERPISLRRI